MTWGLQISDFSDSNFPWDARAVENSKRSHARPRSKLDFRELKARRSTALLHPNEELVLQAVVHPLVKKGIDLFLGYLVPLVLSSLNNREVLRIRERKSKMAIKLVPFDYKQSPQVRVPEKLATSLVALHVPALPLTRLGFVLACNPRYWVKFQRPYPVAIPEW